MAATANSGNGQATPDDSNDEFTVAAFIVQQMMAEMSTMKLVVVNAVTGGGTAAAGTVTVTPLVSQIDGNGNGTPHGKLPPIPWSRLQGGKNAIICDPQVGDVGYVVAADRDISTVKNTKKAALPATRRQFDIADGIYAGSCLGVAPNQFLIFTTDGVRLVDANNNSLAFTSTGFSMQDGNGNSIVSSSTGMTQTFAGGNKIIMAAGFVNIVAPALQVNGVPVIVP
jgi:hypothetical protein